MSRTRKTLAIVGTVTATTAILGGISPAQATPPSPLRSDPACITATGDPAEVVEPGIGEVTVTITLCDGVISTASSALSQSNYGRNKRALRAMDELTLEYALTDINMISYSGATLTSEAYRASLQSALTKTKPETGTGSEI